MLNVCELAETNNLLDGVYQKTTVPPNVFFSNKRTLLASGTVRVIAQVEIKLNENDDVRNSDFSVLGTRMAGNILYIWVMST